MSVPLKLANEPLTLSFHADAAGPPSLEPLSAGRTLFKVNAAGSVTGALTGTIRSAITEVIPTPSIYQRISIVFMIETNDGVLEGFYKGAIYHPSAPLATVQAHGHILTMSAAYVDLYLADVSVTSEVTFVDGRSTGEKGTMIITPHP